MPACLTMPGFALFAALAVSLSAQNVSPSAQNQDLFRAARNPYDLARFIDSNISFDWGAMWKALGREPILLQPCGKLSGGQGQCSTELITVLDPDQIILLIQGAAAPFDVYLRFLEEKAGTWRVAGAREAVIRNHPRRHEVDRCGGKPFLRISSQGLRGSDVDSEIEEWFDLTQPGFEPVFSFPVNGHQHRLGFGISRNIFTYITCQKDEIDIVLEVNFSGGEHVLGVGEYSATYRRSSASGKFSLENAYVFIGRRSKMPNRDFEALADLDEGPSNEDLIRLVMPELRDLASGADDSAKGWLKEFLLRAHDTPEVRELKALLR